MSTEIRVAINTISNYISSLIVMATGLFLTPFLIEHLGTTMLGLQVLATQALQYCMLINSSANQGFSRFATVHYAKGEYEEMNKILGRGLAFAMILAIPSLLAIAVTSLFPGVFFGLTEEIIPYARAVILMTGVGSIVQIILSVFNVSLFIKQKFYVFEIENVVSGLLSVLLVVIIFSYSPPSILTWVILVVGISLFVKIAYVLPVAMHSLPEMKIRPVWGGLKESRGLISFSSMTFLASLGYLLYYATDSIIISNLNELGADKIIVYNIGQRWDITIRSFVLALAMAITPALTSIVAIGDHAKLIKVFYRCLRYSLMIGFLPCIILFVYSYPFIALWIDYDMARESSPILRLTMLNLSFCLPAIMGYQLFIALGKVFAASISTIIGGVFNVVLSIIFVKVFKLGLIGIALGTLITLGVKNLFVFPLLITLNLNIKLVDLIKFGYFKIFLAVIPTVIIAYLMKAVWMPECWPVLLSQFAICSLCYLFAVYYVAFNEEDKERTQTYFGRIFNNFRKI